MIRGNGIWEGDDIVIFKPILLKAWHITIFIYYFIYIPKYIHWNKSVLLNH